MRIATYHLIECPRGMRIATYHLIECPREMRIATCHFNECPIRGYVIILITGGTQ
jgi:hypothetical protein